MSPYLEDLRTEEIATITGIHRVKNLSSGNFIEEHVMSNSLNASSRDDFQALWSQLPDQPRITPDQVRARALRLARDVRRRAIAGAIILVLGIGHPVIATLFRTRPIAWWEWVLIGYLVAFAMVILWITRATRRRPEPAAAGVECVQVSEDAREGA